VVQFQKKTLPQTEGEPSMEPPKPPKRQGQVSAVDGARKPAKRRRSNNDEEKTIAVAPSEERISDGGNGSTVQGLGGSADVLYQSPNGPSEDTKSNHGQSYQHVPKDAANVNAIP
jgi:hypothetical protein